MKYERKYGSELQEIITKVAKDPSLLHEFLYDLLTPTEYMDLAIRWQIIKQLHQKVPQREIAKSLHVSVATVTRGAREMMNKAGGFRKILDKYYKENTGR